MIIPTARLDATSLAYLQRVEQTRGASGAGAFFFMPSGIRSATATGWLIVLGLAALGIVAFLVWPGPSTESYFKAITGWQMILTAVGVLFVALAVRRIGRKKPKNALGFFRFFDALHMWVVSSERVEALPLESLKDIDGTMYRGSNTYAKIVLSFPQGRREFMIPNPDRAKVEFLVRFVHTMIRLRNSDDAGLRALSQSSPALTGTVAARVARGENIGDLSSLPVGQDPPRPTQVEADPADRPRTGLFGVFVPWLAAAAAAVLAFYLAPHLDRFFLDEYAFTNARREADEKHSPSLLRQYLANPANYRHRDEAQAQINVFYDEAIAQLKKQAQGKAMDESIFKSVLALLEALKKTDRPVVTVGFRGTQDAAPPTDDLKAKEKELYDQLLEERPDLKGVAQRSRDNTAILPVGETFTPDNTRNREAVILGRLRDSVQKMLGADILTLDAVAPGETPVMEVTYHAYADGNLYVYTSTVTNPIGGNTEETKGLLRKYEVSWVITMRPPGTDQTYESKLGSIPGSNLHYDADTSDPDWAPYAIILYSAFNDMSKRLVGDFAVIEEAPAAASEETYRFADVVHPK